MRSVAEWLVAKPERAVFVMIATFLLPLTRMFGSAALVLLTLRHGIKRAALIAAIALAVVIAISLVGGQSMPQIVLMVLELWLPGLFFRGTVAAAAIADVAVAGNGADCDCRGGGDLPGPR